MLVFDELKKNDPQLRLVALMLAAGLCVLLAGLWWVQIVSAREFQSHQETQAYRTVRIPAPRGKILDREGRVLAENRPRYDLSLFLDDFHNQFQAEYNRLRPVKITVNSPPFWKFWARSKSVVTNRVRLKQNQIDALTQQAHYDVASTVAAQLSQKLQQPITINLKDFENAYQKARALPYPILKNLDETQLARFEENYSGGQGADLVLQPTRTYPDGTTVGHLLGYVVNDNSSVEGEDAFFNYRLPDVRGVVGIEGGFDSQLRGHAGEESMQVNNLGYRQTNSDNILDAPNPGHNVVLTIDLDIQRAAEKSLAAHQGAEARGAVVVIDVRTGDVLAMVSSPEINPVFSSNSPAYLNDPKLQPQINRATYASYIPGSIFKPVVALAALENGLNPNEIYQVQPNPEDPAHGCIYVGKRKIKDTVHPGNFDLRKAIEESSNSYFINAGLQYAGIEKVVRLGEKFHFGETNGLPTFQDAHGNFPTMKRIHQSDWRDGDSANIFFGQGEVNVTPMQIAVAYSAIANGGTVLWPRLVERIEPQDPADGDVATAFPSGLVRDKIGVSQHSLQIVSDAMLSETEDPAGSGYNAFHNGNEIGLRVCGKTGTAQRENEHNQIIGWNYWFASFAPYDDPKYAVVVMVQTESGGSGGIVCAPIAHDIYAEILKKEKSPKQMLTTAN